LTKQSNDFASRKRITDEQRLKVTKKNS